MTAATVPRDDGDRLRWVGLALVFGASTISYLDRQSIALLKPELERSFHWTDRDYGHISSAFQLATLASILIAGWLVDRVGLRRGYAAGVGVWSVAAMAQAVVTTVGGFIAVRATLAAAEAVGTPAAVKAVGGWFREKDRSFALGVMNTAPNAGAVMAPLLIPPMAVLFGWKATFAITGAFGFLWLVCWFAMPQATPASKDSATTPLLHRNVVGVLTSKGTWTIAVLKFLTDFVWAFMLSWAPDLFHKRYGLDTGALQLPIAAVFTLAGLGAFFGGWFSSYLLRSGRSLNFARKTPMALAAVMATPAPLVMFAPGLWTGVALIGMVLAAHQIFSTNVFGLATDITPNRDLGLVVGLGATLANLSALGMHELTGYVLDSTGSYLPMLIMCGLAYATAFGALHLLTPNLDSERAVSN